MSYATFKGGVHPFDGKDMSKDKPVTEYLPKGEMVYPLSQHIGAPAKAVVAPGDEVLAGQIIGEASGFVSANVVSSVSGRVKAIEPRMLVTGVISDSIIVENDGEYKTVEGLGTPRDYTQMTKEEIREAIKAAGIVGMGGAGFPTHVKLTPKDDGAIDYVIVNGAECEPYLTSDYRMMLEEPERIVTGLKVILSLFERARGVIAIEENKPEAIKRLKEVVQGEERIEVRPLRTKYPQGAERNLIYAVSGRKLNSKKLPADMGCVVSNIDTVISVGMAVCEQTPLMRRIVTVTGDAIADPRNFSVKTGTNYAELVEAAGGYVCEPEKVIAGGPMMGNALTTLDVPVTKTSSALLALGKDAVAEFEPSACIHCGRCVRVCPSGLVPQKMREVCERYDLDLFEKLYGMECYECGSCTYACPAKLPLTQSFKQARKAVAERRRQAAQAAK
ncbi:MAG: electron transport complex subunit RsxC [Lachnospiraceae bacterium]|nr:electron transport complex subunit RsxC [Lachnospiraceae bacterium]